MRTATQTLHALSVFQSTRSFLASLFAALLISSLALAPATQAQTPLMQVEDSNGDIRFEVNDDFSWFPSLFGIGTNSPVTPLHVAGSQGSFRAHPIFAPSNSTVLLGTWEASDGNAPQIRYLGAGSGFFDLGMDADGNFTIERNDTPRFTVLTGGNVGIGTTTPSSRLSVAGVIESTTGGIKFPDGSIQTTAGGSGDDGDWTIDGSFLTTFNRGLTVSGDVGQVRASIGRGAVASGDNTFATGINTTASGAYSTALNRATNATGTSSTAMGQGAEAVGDVSLAAGISTSAEGTASAALGQNTTASGGVSTALGNGTTSSGFASVAMGTSTIADRSDMLAVGRYNAPGFDPSNVLFAIGNGTGTNARSNALTVDADGDVFALGQILANTDLLAGGEIGVNVTSPVTRLHVAGNKSGGASAGNHIAVIQNFGGPSSDVLYLQAGSVGSNLDGANNFITFADGAGNGVGAVEGENGNVEFKTTGADFAELLPRLNVNEVIEAGRIVGITNGKVTQRTTGAERLMVVSDRAGFVGNMQPNEEEEARFEKIAFVGQVPTWVEGRVNMGDWIVASGRGDGIGRAVAPEAWDPAADGPIVGQAWEAQTGGTGRVNTAIGLDTTKPLIDRLARQQEQLDQQAQLLQRMEERLRQLEARTN